MEYKYLFATKGRRTLNLKYNSNWEMTCFDYLVDKGYKLRAGSKEHWMQQIDEDGSMTDTYLLDDELKRFDVGTY